MAEIGVKQLRTNASAVISEVERGRSYLVTRRGRSAAVLLPVEEAELLVLSNADAFFSLRKTARAAYARGRSTGLKDLD
jgi:prevent-host-death family protein